MAMPDTDHEKLRPTKTYALFVRSHFRPAHNTRAMAKSERAQRVKERSHEELFDFERWKKHYGKSFH